MVLPMPSSASVLVLAPWNSAGYSSAPAPTMQPWPRMRRGTECSVPIPPGFVSEIVVPTKSAAVSLLLRALPTSASYSMRKSPKLMVSVFLMPGTSSARVPSGFGMSIARPRFRCAGVTTTGLPSTSS